MVKGFAPAWLIAEMPVPMVPESVESDVLVPTFEIVPISFCAPDTVIGELVPLGLNWRLPVPEIAP